MAKPIRRPRTNPNTVTVQAEPEGEPSASGSFILPLTFVSNLDVAPGWNVGDRDSWLRSFWPKFGNDILQAVLAVSVAKIQTQNWVVEGPKRLATMYHRIIRDEADFKRGYGQMIARGVIDYYTQDNGWFMERLRSAPDDLEGPCLGLAHVDSARMFATGFDDYPYVYRDVYGEDHLMHTSQFIRLVDMPTPATGLRTPVKGFCALSRALSTAIVLSLLMTLKREKLSDLPPSALAVFNNISSKQFEKALRLYESQEDAKGNAIWRSLLPLFGMDPAHPSSIQFVPLREVWQNFDEMTAMNVAVYSFAAAWRMDPREFWPVSAGPLGTGKEAEIQHQKAKAKSSGLLFTEIERAFNADDTLPKGVAFRFQLQDAEEEMQRAAIHKLQIENIVAMQNAGAQLTASEVRWLLANHYRVLPSSMTAILEEGVIFEPERQTYTLDDVERYGTKDYYGFDLGPNVVIDGMTGKVIGGEYSPPLITSKALGNEEVTLLDRVKILPAERRRQLKSAAGKLIKALDVGARLDDLESITDAAWDAALAKSEAKSDKALGNGFH